MFSVNVGQLLEVVIDKVLIFLFSFALKFSKQIRKNMYCIVLSVNLGQLLEAVIDMNLAFFR